MPHYSERIFSDDIPALNMVNTIYPTPRLLLVSPSLPRSPSNRQYANKPRSVKNKIDLVNVS